MIKNSKPNEEVDDVENEDEFDNYMEERLMADAENLGILDKAKESAGEEVFTQALQRVKQEVAKVPQEESKVVEESKEEKGEDDEQHELDKFGDDLMNKMMEEGL